MPGLNGFGPLDFLFYIILVAIVFMLVRPGGQGGQAVITVSNTFAKVVAAAEGGPGSAAVKAAA